MIGVRGIGGVPEPANSNQANVRSKPSIIRQTSTLGRDDVRISDEALAASRLADFVEQAEERSEETQAERLDQLRAKLEQGSHKVNQVVKTVAARVSSYVAAQP